MMTENIYKHSSAPGCISAAYDMLLENRKNIFRKLALPAIAFGISLTVCLLAYTPNKALNDWGLCHPTLTMLLLIGAALLAVGVSFWLVAATFTLLNEKKLISNFRRSLVVFVVIVVYELLIFGAQYLCMNVIGNMLLNRFADKAVGVMILCSLLFLLLYIVILVAFLPYVFSTTKYLYDHTTILKGLFTSDYKRGWKNLGHIFLTMLLMTILIAVVTFIASTPFVIAFMAQASNQLGMLEGDPSGAPAHLLWIVVVVSFFTMTLMAFVFVWEIFVLVHLYGSIETRETERLGEA